MTFTYPTKPACLWIHCPVCGRGIVVASGCIAMTLSRLRIAQILREVGWQIVPKLKCELCIKYNL